MPANAVGGFGFFEFYCGDAQTYHRVLIPDIMTAIDAVADVEDPPALDVRHAAWPGMDRREIELKYWPAASGPSRTLCGADERRRPARNGSAFAGSRKPGGGPRSRPPSSGNTAHWRRRLSRPWNQSSAPGSGSERPVRSVSPPLSTPRHVPPIMRAVGWRPPDLGIRGATEESATHSPCTPLTRQYWSTTAIGSESSPIRQVPDHVPGGSHGLPYPGIQGVIVA